MPTLRELRTAKVWSIRDLASRAGVSTATIVAIEHGKASLRFVTMRKIASALGVEPGEIDEFQTAIRQAAEGKAAA
ncbi:MAG: helix-turn-helix domain-containing protein [Chloroflexota bacterium]|nr:helix-turn-helix domain-containing protein [Chloroflexota bacterium]